MHLQLFTKEIGIKSATVIHLSRNSVTLNVDGGTMSQARSRRQNRTFIRKHVKDTVEAESLVQKD